MVKVQTGGNTTTKELLTTPKQGFVNKKKNQKFKQTPMGKFALINNAKVQNSNNMKNQKNIKKENSVSPQKSPKNVGKKNSPMSNKKKQTPPKQSNNKKAMVRKEDESDEDINEGIIPKEEMSFTGEDLEDSDDVSDDDDDVPNIFGASLADDTDEDDEDFDEDENEVETENKGVKMFKGLKSKNQTKGDSSEDTSGHEMNSSMSTSERDSDDDDDDDDDDDEDEDSEVDDECNESSLGLKALLGNSIAEDDDDDDDFEAEEDDEDEDISDEDDDVEDEKNTNGKVEKSTPEKAKLDKNTIFVGNLPKTVTKTQLRKLFSKFGTVISARLRGIVPEDPNMSKKVAAITKKIHPKQKTIHAYITFKLEESVEPALSLNGHKFGGNYLRVDKADGSTKVDKDPKKSVFLGNLPFKADSNDIWEHFKDCGEIDSVRVVKDSKTRIGKGIAYVNFKNEDSVALALELNGTQLLNREIRVRVYTQGGKSNKTNKKEKKKRSLSTDSKHSTSPKKVRNNSGAAVASPPNKENVSKKTQKKQQGKQNSSPQGNNTFQGQKADIKKKKGPNKLEKQKKIMAAKLTAKPKKPMK